MRASENVSFDGKPRGFRRRAGKDDLQFLFRPAGIVRRSTSNLWMGPAVIRELVRHSRQLELFAPRLDHLDADAKLLACEGRMKRADGRVVSLRPRRR
jgi:hypothetical protein